MRYGSLLRAPFGLLEGITSVFEFGGSISRFDPDVPPDQVDRLALESDWRAVGREMWVALHQIERQLPGASVGQANQTGGKLAR